MGYLHRRRDYIFVSNILQGAVVKTDIWKSFLSDHSPVFISLGNSERQGSGFWKFNTSLPFNRRENCATDGDI